MYIADIVLVGLIFAYIIYVNIKKILDLYYVSLFYIYIYIYVQMKQGQKREKVLCLASKFLLIICAIFRKQSCKKHALMQLHNHRQVLLN